MCDVNLITGRPKRRRPEALGSRPLTVLAPAGKLGKSRASAEYRDEFVNIKGLHQSAPVRADEATSSLESESEAAITEAMTRLMVGRTTVIVAHRLSTVRALDHLLMFDNGRIVEDGDHGALLRIENGRYRRLFEHQSGNEPETILF